jgi:hypothetical protein
MAATNWTVIVKNKKTEKAVLINLVSKWTYKQALAIAKESFFALTFEEALPILT